MAAIADNPEQLSLETQVTLHFFFFKQYPQYCADMLKALEMCVRLILCCLQTGLSSLENSLGRITAALPKLVVKVCREVKKTKQREI